MEKKTKQKRDTRGVLIDAVYEVVAKDGLENTTVARLGQVAGLAPPMVYHHFSGKEELLKAAFDNVYREVDAELEQAFVGAGFQEHAPDFKELATCFWNVFLEYMVNNPSKAVFYNRYRNSGYISDEIWLAQKDTLVFFNRVFYRYMSEIRTGLDEDSFTMLWSFVLDSALTLAIRSAKTGRRVTEQMKRGVYFLIDSLKTIESGKITN